jgi:predicted MFS family arabinose efflux permease
MLRVYRHFRQYGSSHTPLFAVSVMIFFWCLYDGIISYITPLVLTESGLTKTLMGVVIASSSLTGGVFDFLLSKILPNAHFRRIYLAMFAVCLVYPLLLWQAKTLWVFLLSMALWGVYYDLLNFGDFDFVSRTSRHSEHTSSFGVISVFKSLGYIIAPIFAGLLIGELVDWRPFAMAWIFLVIAIIFYVLVLLLTRKNQQIDLPLKPVSWLGELRQWKSLGRVLLPLLILTMLINILDAFFWTIGPLFAESFTSIRPFNGLFLSANLLPALLVGWIIGSVTSRFGKKKTAFFSFFAGSLILSGMIFFKQPFIVIGLVFIASAFQALAVPALNGTYADFVTETPTHEKEVIALSDFATNAGYVIGPILAGILADTVGSSWAFAVIGLLSALIILVLWPHVPRHIKIPIA